MADAISSSPAAAPRSPVATRRSTRDELPKATQRCQSGGGDLIQIPNYLSAIAIIYNLPGVDSLQLDPDTTAKIFRGEITKWNDPAIAATNPGADLPDTDITPVHRSDESGTTANFTDYLHEAAGNVWTDDPDSTWPLKTGESGAQTSGMVQAVKAGEGAIGYADESQARTWGRQGQGRQHVRGAERRGATADFDQSQKDPALSQGQNVFAYKVQRTPTDPSSYPVLLVSYLMGCTKYDSTETTDLVKAYFTYMISYEGSRPAAQNAGSAPIGRHQEGGSDRCQCDRRLIRRCSRQCESEGLTDRRVPRHGAGPSHRSLI